MFKTAIILLLLFSTLQSQEALPRKVLALYTLPEGILEEVSDPAVKTYLEMPLNYLGMSMIPLNANKEIPKNEDLEGLRSIVLWFEGSLIAPHTDALLDMIEDLVGRGVKLVIMGNLGMPTDQPIEENTSNARTNRLLRMLGLLSQGAWSSRTYDSTFKLHDPRFYNFEKSLGSSITPYLIAQQHDEQLHLILSAIEEEKSGTSSILAAIHPNGGYVAADYSIFSDVVGENEILYWYLNPFLFLEKALQIGGYPVPDPTTVAGRRLFYSHMDGDGWYNITQIPSLQNERLLSSEIIYKEICLPFQDLPITIGMIGAEVDLAWNAQEAGIDVAKQMYNLPHIEVGSHTFTHPFYWKFFEDYTPSKEEPFLSLYPKGAWEKETSDDTIIGRLHNAWRNIFGNHKHEGTSTLAIDVPLSPSDLSQKQNLLPEGYYIPRYYAKEPFNLELEVRGAIDIMKSVSPPEKKCELYQWSGDAMPFEAAVKATRDALIPNINGGGTRFDTNFPSYAWVSPLGRLVGKEQQIYASCSNEVTYTDLWTRNYFAFRELLETFRNTETPIRIKPMHIYFHAFSGERLASLNALRSNFEYARNHKICPVPASLYTKMAQGFYTAEFIPVGDMTFQVKNREKLQTIRFDHAALLGVDFANSKGVVGQKHLHGSLYVYLDELIEVPTIALKETQNPGVEPTEITPYLIESSWRVYGLSKEGYVSFTTEGFGSLDMLWSVPKDGEYSIRYKTSDGQEEVTTFLSEYGLLRITLPPFVGTLKVNFSILN